MTKDELIELKEKVLKLEEAGEIEKIFNCKTMYQRFKEVAQRKPDEKAILYFGNVITYRQMLTLIDNAAKGFQELGIKYNDVVTMSMLSTPYGIVSLYALDKIGATMHMVNSASSIDEIKRELSNFNSKYFIANDIFYGKDARIALKESGIEKVITTSLVDALPMGFNGDKLKYELIEKLKGVNKKEFNGKTLINFEQLLAIGRNSNVTLNECEFNEEHIATIAYTSGSTGNSKACTATWRGLDSMVQVMGMTETGRFEQTDVMFTTFPLWIYYSLLNMIHEPLSLGVALALDPLFNPKDIIKRNEQYQFNHWLTIPPYIKAMTELGKNTDCSKWKIIITGGDALLDSVKIKADQYIAKNNGKAKVEQGYGASEVLGSFAYCYHENPTLGSLGVPCVGNKIKIIDIDTGKILGPNETGVGYLYTPARMNGYYGDEDSTNHSLVKDEKGVIWYNTEDLMHQNEKGEIFLDGRIRRIVLTIDSKGNPTKIIPERAKKELSKLDMIDKCEVITVPDDKKVNKPIAFVSLKKYYENETKLKEEIISYCEKNIPEYMVPREIFFIEELPLNTSKKPDLKELEKMYYNMDNQERKGKIKVRNLFNKK